MTGTVKRLVVDRGFGFVSGEDAASQDGLGWRVRAVGPP